MTCLLKLKKSNFACVLGYIRKSQEGIKHLTVLGMKYSSQNYISVEKGQPNVHNDKLAVAEVGLVQILYSRYCLEGLSSNHCCYV